MGIREVLESKTRVCTQNLLGLKKTLLKQIAFFDFDGTITTKDTLLEFIKYTKGKFGFYMGFLLHSPFLIAYKLKLIPNQTAKEKILSFFYKKNQTNAFNQECKFFAENILPGLIRPKALEEILKYKEQGTRVVIVSASPENWIRPWTESLQIELLATRLEIQSDCLTGKITGKNCYGDEKVRRIQELFTLTDYDHIHTYGDTSGDLPMLKLGTIQFYKPFR